MSARRGLIGFGTVLVAGLIALLVAGASAKPTRAFSLDVPNVGPASTLYRGQGACETPIPVPSAFGGLQIWASSIGGDALLAATVSDAASGRRRWRAGRRSFARAHLATRWSWSAPSPPAARCGSA